MSFAFLKSWPARVITILLVAQAGVMYSSIRPEAVPPGRPLAGFPTTVGGWQMRQEGVIDAETQAILQADDLLTRVYAEKSGRAVDLYIAAFRSQRNGKTPHSPKNCLPGSGWTPLTQGELQIDVGGRAPITVNRYVVEHGESRSVVLYWYQSRDRVVASEYRAKFWVVADAIRLNRTDSALVRVIAPIVNQDANAATASAVDFVKTVFGPIRAFLPS